VGTKQERDFMVTIDRPRSLTEVVTAYLRKEIVDGEFELGQALSESKIAARYEVSRTPVREAFACLGLEGLVRTEPQRGTFVFTMDRAQFAQISETRSILEIAAVRLANERNREELVREWDRLVGEMTDAIEARDARRYSQCDGAFHQTLFDLAENPFLAAAGQSFSAKMAAVRNRLGSQPAHMAESYDQHLELLAHLKRGDIDKVADLLERHIRFKGESFWSVPETAPKSRWERMSEVSE
jgi:DNA-binding GntR family transcriptional regulator